MSDSSAQQEHHIVTWAEVHRDTRKLVRKLLNLGPWEGIIALTRGGLVPAAIVAREMGIRIVDTLCITTYEEMQQGTLNVLKTPDMAMAVQGEGWLILDDLVDTGTTAKEARRLLPKACFAVVYAKPKGKDTADVSVHDIPQDQWVVFPWDSEPQYVSPLGGGRD